MENDENKWKCEVCTYENWPSALKCTICATSKKHATKNDDIYKLANLVISNESTNNSDNENTSSQATANLTTTTNNISTEHNNLISGIQIVEKQKWNCTACTYLNWPRSKKCVQCHTPRLLSCSNTAHSSRRSSPRSPNSPNQTLKINNQQIKTLDSSNNTTNAINNALKKWSCKVCTYQNWPKSQRCVMCHVNRSSNSSSISSASSTSVSQTDLTSNNNNSTRKSPQNTLNKSTNNNNNNETETTVDLDRLFLLACQGVVDNDLIYLHNYIKAGGDPTRFLNSEEVEILNRPKIFFVGLTLLHLCYQFKRKECLMKLIRNSKKKILNLNKNLILQQQQQQQQHCQKQRSHMFKFSPCQSCPLLASNIIDRYFIASLRQNPPSLLNHQISLATPPQSLTSFTCHYVNDCHTFTLPSDIENDFPLNIQKVLFDELLDRDVQHELEIENQIINWNPDLNKRLSSSLYPLWNRHSGDCLLDSVLQACYGVFDTDNMLRSVMAECLERFAASFKPRWKDHELIMAQSLGYTIDDVQLEQDWSNIINLANTPGSSLEQAHIFALCHIFRRPIIIYSVKYVKSFRGENIGYTHFEGLYLPLLWDPSFCFKNPIVLGYTRGHFTALVNMEHSYQQANMNTCGLISGNATNDIPSNDGSQVFYLPLTNVEGQLLPIHFLTSSEVLKTNKTDLISIF